MLRRFLFIATVLFVFNEVCFALEGERFTNSVGMKFVRIEPGTYRMGQPKPVPWGMLPQDAGPGTRMDLLHWGDFDEKPVHTVTISKPFYMGMYEVTNKQYELFDPGHKRLRGKRGVSQEDDEPVVFVNWYNARAFCDWLSDQEGRPYRLPTEAEWEYACRAGTQTNFSTGDWIPWEYLQKPWQLRDPEPADLAGDFEKIDGKIGKHPRNSWGLYDMHGNVEEWCHDWYGPYQGAAQTDPVGYRGGTVRVVRGGSFGTYQYYLRSANRMGALPKDRHWALGFRVVVGELPETEPLPEPAAAFNQRGVINRSKQKVMKGPDEDEPYFEGPKKFVRIPPYSYGPLYSIHNHDPAIVECPNGDLLTCWYTCISEKNRDLGQAASRLVYGADEWQRASPFWNMPDRNDHAPAMWFDGDKTIYHFTGMSFGSAYGPMAVVMRTSKDSGATWSKARIILPDHTKGHMPVEAVFRLNDGTLAFTSDASPTLWFSKDQGYTWESCGGAIAGDHPGVTQLDDGSLLAFTRDEKVDGKMPIIRSNDMGKTWDYKASPFPPIHGGQRLVLLKLQGGDLFLASFADNGIMITDASGEQRKVYGLFAAVSEDGGKSWPYKRLVTHDGPGRPVETMDGSLLTLSQRYSEPWGYLSVCQSQDGLIHLISSRQHYAFNLKWCKTPAPELRYEPVKVEHMVETFTGPKEFDNKGWANRRGYKGGFNGAGQYTIDCYGRASGVNHIIGKGSFEASFSFKNIEFKPPHERTRPGVYVWIQDGSSGIKVNFRRGFIALGEPPEEKYPCLPESAKLKIIRNDEEGRWRIYYGINGEEAVNEIPSSKKGLFYDEPMSESSAVFLLPKSCKVDVDHFEIKPL